MISYAYHPYDTPYFSHAAGRQAGKLCKGHKMNVSPSHSLFSVLAFRRPFARRSHRTRGLHHGRLLFL